MNRLALTFTLLSLSITPALAQQTAKTSAPQPVRQTANDPKPPVTGFPGSEPSSPIQQTIAYSAPGFPGGEDSSPAPFSLPQTPTAPAPATTTVQPSVTPMAPPPDDTPLAIPMPPGARLRIEMDARDSDILGVFKSLLQGMSEGTVGAVKALKPADAARLNEEMSNANLADVLKNVTHIHFELFELSSTPTGGVKKITTAFATQPSTMHLVDTDSSDANEVPFYENAFSGEGGHRILFTDFDEFHMLMTGFDQPHGYALVVDFPGMVAILRSNGYPDLEKLSSLGPIIADAFQTGMSMSNQKSLVPNLVPNNLAPKHLSK